jgi:hypothetical protein
MKLLIKVAVVFALVLMISGTAVLQAQSNPPMFGFRIAPNVGWLKPDATKYDGDGAVFGFSWGFIVEFPFAENYSLASGFNVVFNNGKLKYPHRIDTTGLMHRKYNLKYLELPFMIQMRTTDRGGPVFHANIGFGGGIRLDAHAEGRFTPDDGDAVEFDRDKISEEINLLRASLLIGAGVEYPVGASSKLRVGLQFNNGFTNILKGPNNADPAIDHSAMPNFIELNLGFIF